MELELERIVHGGVTLTRLPGGRVALVRGGIPGERVEAELVERAGVLQGHVMRVLEPHPDRVEASVHPGLDLSHMTYARQLLSKREVVADALRRAGGTDREVPDVVPAPREWSYRHAVQPAVAGGAIGYRAPGTNDLVPLERDPVAHPSVDAAWRIVRERLPIKGVREIVLRGNDAGETLAALVASASSRNYLDAAHDLVRAGIRGVHYTPFDARGRFRGGFERLAGDRALLQRFGRFELTVNVQSFSQPNPAAASRLFDELEAWAGGGGTALDLYAGGGVIALHLARSYERVVALELNAASVARGERDLERLGVTNVSFLKADARKVDRLPDAELIAVDPPRAGLAKEARALVDASSASRLLYVSCDVATWSRDVVALEALGWRLERLQPFDFYPQTHHIEMLSLLVR